MKETVEIYMEGLPSQKMAVAVQSVKKGVVKVKNQGGIVSYFRLSDGWQCTSDGTPGMWKFWRLSDFDRFKLLRKQVAS